MAAFRRFVGPFPPVGMVVVVRLAVEPLGALVVTGAAAILSATEPLTVDASLDCPPSILDYLGIR